MAIRRTALITVGGFDEVLGPGTSVPAAEDCDLLWRLCSFGYSGYYEPKIKVSHHHRRQNESSKLKLLKQYEIGRGAYWVKAILDSRRQKQALKNMYWSWRSEFRGEKSPKDILSTMRNELVGALKYLNARYLR